MSYLQSVITPGETVIVQARTHWFIYVKPAFWLLVSLALIAVLRGEVVMLGWLLLLGALFLWFKAWLYAWSTELAVTSKRVIAKFGFIRRSTVELRHGKVESFHVDQSLLGRVFNFGSVVVTGSGGTQAPIPYIADPLGFRSAALTGMETDAARAPERP